MRITQERIDELRTSTPKASMPDILTGEPPYDPEITPLIVEYLTHYAAPKKDANGKNLPGQPCIACDATHSFTWGIEHGHGHCTQCTWPGTLYHFIHNKDGEEVMVIRGTLLWAHPEKVSVRQPA